MDDKTLPPAGQPMAERMESRLHEAFAQFEDIYLHGHDDLMKNRVWRLYHEVLRRALEVIEDSLKPSPEPARRPDFGKVYAEHEGIVLECAAIAPGLTIQDLVAISEKAAGEAGPHDCLSSNPGDWPVVRSVEAVAEALLDAIYPGGRSVPEASADLSD